MVLCEDQYIQLIQVLSFTEKHNSLRSKLGLIKTTINSPYDINSLLLIGVS